MDITIPRLAESVTEGDIGTWLKQHGEPVKKDEPILELETDKATVELAADASGTLEILIQAGETVRVGDVVGRIVEGGAAPPGEPPKAREEAPQPAEPAPRLAEPASQPAESAPSKTPAGTTAAAGEGEEPPAERPVDGRPLREVAPPARASQPAEARPEPAPASHRDQAPPVAAGREPTPGSRADEPGTRRERMTRLRQRIAERLVEAQRTAAILTTFNEIDMSAVLALRSENQERFEAQHGIKLGFMSLFARASILALRDVPALNAFIEGNEIVYHDHVHLGIAVGTPRGLVVPVVRNADRLSFAETEKRIKELATRARDGEIAIEDLQGGTFTISNGGIYGSLLSTPILNPPQSGILGMHKIEKRPITVEERGEERIVSRPMMYVALSYDHRIVDGEQAVTFLVRVKERLEEPTRLLLDS